MVDVWDPDFWWHLATGKWIVEHGRLPDQDPFSFATLQKDPYTPINRVKLILTQYWLAQILLYKIYSLYGFAGVSVMRAMILTLTVAILFPLLRLYRVSTTIILPLIIVSAYLLKPFAGERPQLFSFLFAGIVIYLMEKMSRPLMSDKDSRSSRLKIYHLLLLLCMPLWANLHGGFIYGIVVIAIYLVSHWLSLFIRKRRLETVDIRPYVKFTTTTSLAVLLTLLNPNTYYSLINHFRYKPFIYLMYVQEFTPTFKLFHTNKGYFAMLVLLTLLIFVELVRTRRINISHLLLFIFNAFISLLAVRFVPLFLVSGSFLIGVYLNKLIKLKIFEKNKGLEAIATLLICMCIIGAGFLTGRVSVDKLYLTGVEYTLYPYAAADFLKTLPPRRIFNPYTWGGYLIWRLYPQYKVFIDGRGLNQEIFLQYMEVVRVNQTEFGGLPKWKAILNSYGIDYIIIAPYHEYSMGLALTYALVDDQDWQLIFADDFALVFVRNTKEFKPLIKKYSLPGDIVYAVTAQQALKKAYTKTTPKKKKVAAFVTAIDALVRINKLEDAKYALYRAYEIAPDDKAVWEWIKALGLEEEFK
jgi:hypothetical protein